MFCFGKNLNIQNLQRAITPKLGNQELRFLHTALLLIQIYHPIKFHIDTSYIFLCYAPKKTLVCKRYKGNNSKNMMCTVMFLVHWLLLNKIYPSVKFHDFTSYTFWVMLRKKNKYEIQQRAVTPKTWRAELWLLYTAIFLNEIYPPMKFHIDTS